MLAISQNLFLISPLSCSSWARLSPYSPKIWSFSQLNYRAYLLPRIVKDIRCPPDLLCEMASKKVMQDRCCSFFHNWSKMSLLRLSGIRHGHEGAIPFWLLQGSWSYQLDNCLKLCQSRKDFKVISATSAWCRIQYKSRYSPKKGNGANNSYYMLPVLEYWRSCPNAAIESNNLRILTLRNLSLCGITVGALIWVSVLGQCRGKESSQ